MFKLFKKEDTCIDIDNGGHQYFDDTGYPHDGRTYRHDRRADKRRYPHDRDIDIQMLLMLRN